MKAEIAASSGPYGNTKFSFQRPHKERFVQPQTLFPWTIAQLKIRLEIVLTGKRQTIFCADLHNEAHCALL